jgi:hypothetical protein
MVKSTDKAMLIEQILLSHKHKIVLYKLNRPGVSVIIHMKCNRTDRAYCTILNIGASSIIGATGAYWTEQAFWTI